MNGFVHLHLSFEPDTLEIQRFLNFPTKVISCKGLSEDLNELDDTEMALFPGAIHFISLNRLERHTQVEEDNLVYESAPLTAPSNKQALSLANASVESMRVIGLRTR